MPRTHRAVALVVAAATALSTVALLASGPADAAATNDITLTGPSRGAAGACLTFTATPTDAFGRPATDTGTVVVRLTETSDSAQDVDFCRAGTMSTPTVPPHYVNASGTTQRYVAGSTITSTATSATDVPDVASATTPAAQANPSGTDTAVYTYDGRTGASTAISFGVVGLVPGGATIDVFRSADGDETLSPGDVSRSQSVSFSAGGLPGSPQAADAVAVITATPAQSYSPQGGAAHSFAVAVSNAVGDGVRGVTPSIAATSGPNAVGSFTASCAESDNTGRATCTYSGTKAGTDTVTIWVDQTKARTPQPTAGLDPNEPRVAVTATTTVPAAQAKLVDLEPATSSTTVGVSKELTATVTNGSGAPAVGVGLTFTETGPGTIVGGTTGSGSTSTLSATTDAKGQATVTIANSATQAGTETVTAAIRNPSSTLCQTTGGRCADTATLTVTAVSPSPSPSPSPTRSPSPSPTITCTTTATLLAQEQITATEYGTVTVTGRPGSQVDLYAYTRPSTTYAVVRSGVVGPNGAIAWQVRPPRNTRFYARQRGCPPGNTVVLGVRTALTIAAVRNGTRTYTFYGDSLPARPGGLIVSLYRITPTGEVLTSQTRASEATGEWSLTRRFTGSGTFGFVLRTGQDLSNAPGQSHVRPTAIF